MRDAHATPRLSETHDPGGERTTRRLPGLCGYRIAPGEVDIRGWLVVAEDGHRVGRVRDLIIDPQEQRFWGVRRRGRELQPYVCSV